MKDFMRLAERFLVGVAIGAGVCALAQLAGGCYIGRASFEGENMKMYPFFSVESSSSAGAGAE